MEGVSDNRILAMAKRIGDNPKLRKLALNLGSEMEEADRFIKMNRMNGEVSYEGTRIMLCTWREDTPRKEQWATLKTALIDAGLAGIADEFSSRQTGWGVGGDSASGFVSKRDAPDPDGDEEELHKRLRDRCFLGLAVERLRLESLGIELEIEIEKLLVINESLEERYTDPARFADGILLQKQDFQPVLKRMDSSSESLCSMENSRHEIFPSPMATKLPRRITVSGSNTAKLTALIRSLLYDWATENRASDFLLQQQHLFELRANDMKPNQTIESAIKNQLFPDLDEVDEALIRQMLKDMPDAITILLHGLNGKNCGKNIMDVLSGRTLQEVTVMVTTRPRFANMLHRMSPGLYDRIEMH